mgnify:CR=1 FL=1
MVFICEICNYKTERKSNIDRHNNSKKHKANLATDVHKKTSENIPDIKVIETDSNAQRNSAELNEIGAKPSLLCKYCGIEFKRSYNINRHLRICSEKNDLSEKETLKRQLKEKEQQLKKSEMDKEYYRGLIDNLSTLGPKNFNSVTYILNNYANAPPIKTIEPKKLKEFKNLDNKKIETIISLYRNNLLVDYVIEAIVYIHKKDDPSEQSVWVTDSSRHNYIIKELLKDKESYWIIDKKGAKSEKYLIDPVLKFIRENVAKYLANKGNLLNGDITTQKRRIILDSQKDASKLIKEIDDGIINKSIVKKLAKHIHHNTKPLIEEIE